MSKLFHGWFAVNVFNFLQRVSIAERCISYNRFCLSLTV